MKQDIIAQLADYRGVLGWNAYVDGRSQTRPAVEIPLYIKEHSIPIRKRKVTELAFGSTPVKATNGTWDTEGVVLVDGSPDPLQIDLSGWVVTPVSRSGSTIQWAPVDTSGSLLNLGNISYADLITMYLDGRMNPSTGGFIQRKDPDYYISPHGSKYPSPTILTWDPSYAPVQKKQPFTLSMYLES